MSKEYDNLENEAMRFGAGVPAGTKWRSLSNEQQQGFDNYMRTKIRRDPEAFANDTRAKKYLRDYDQGTFDAMRQQELNDSVNPGDFWNDFGAGDSVESDFGNIDDIDQSKETRAREDERDDIRGDEEDEPEQNDSATEGAESPEEQPDDAGEPGMGEGANAPKPKSPGEPNPTEGAIKPTVPGLGDGAKAAGNVAKTAEASEAVGAVGGAAAGAEAGAAAAAVAGEGFVASQATPVGWVLDVIIVLGVVFLLVAGLTALGTAFPDSASGLENTSGFAAAGQPANVISKNKGWTLKDNTDYSGVACATGSNDTGVYTHPTRGFTIRKCSTSIGEVASINSLNIVNMIAAAKLDGITLGGSSLRTYERQQELYEQNCSASGCNPPTAKPGNSMHERGLATDFTQNGNILSKAHTSYSWLTNNAARYGYYNYSPEPWHWSTSGN